MSILELNNALNFILKQVQLERFNKIIEEIRDNETTSTKTTELKALHPFLDGPELLRVGRKIERAKVLYKQKHPAEKTSHHQVHSKGRA